MQRFANAERFPIVQTLAADRFARVLAAHAATLARDHPRVMQINVGKQCNQACHHCHVDAGPKRTETMSDETLAAVRHVVRRRDIRTVDITGGAPELHPAFEDLVSTLRGEGRHVMARTNLTVMERDGYRHLPEFYATRAVELVASLPCYLERNVDAQRGRGVFEASIRVLQRLNAVGYGRADGRLPLNLVYNPQGPTLPPPQAALQDDYRRELGERFGIAFTRLLTITNMPLGRFAEALARSNRLDAYLAALEDAFNVATVPSLMCQHTINVGWDGTVYDCDFNAMLGLPMRRADGAPLTIHDLAADVEPGAAIATGDHCLGCTAGAGSSCGGALT